MLGLSCVMAEGSFGSFVIFIAVTFPPGAKFYNSRVLFLSLLTSLPLH